MMMGLQGGGGLPIGGPFSSSVDVARILSHKHELLDRVQTHWFSVSSSCSWPNVTVESVAAALTFIQRPEQLSLVAQASDTELINTLLGTCCCAVSLSLVSLFFSLFFS